MKRALFLFCTIALASCAGHGSSVLPNANSVAGTASAVIRPPQVSAAFISNAGHIAAPNTPLRSLPRFLKDRHPLGGSTVGPGDVEQLGIAINAGGPYTGIYAAQTAYTPLLLQVGYPPGASGTSSLLAPLIVPSNKSCLGTGEVYSNPGAGSNSSFFVLDLCSGTVAYATPINSAFLQNYTKISARGVPELLSLVVTLDTVPTVSSVWHALIFNYTTAKWEIVASKTGISTSGTGFSLWLSEYVPGRCPVTPPVAADSMFLYNATSHGFEPIQPTMTGTTTSVFMNSPNCFKADVTGPASYTFKVSSPNSSWVVASAPPACNLIGGVSGYYPCDLQQAYSLPVTNGKGQTIGIVDAFDDPNAEADLAKYRMTFGLSACTTLNGCFKKVNQSGMQGSYPAPDTGWATEISLDVDMASAICPNCKILLVEANSNSFSDLGSSVDTAASLGANVISNSYGGGEFSGETSDTHYNHPGVAITASTGDNGFAAGPQYPATSPFLTAVGGTNLTTAGNPRGWTETVWSAAGSGCSAFETKPVWQSDSGCAKRMEADVSAVADPATGVAVYDTYNQPGWQVFGGTSVSSPIIASVYALAGNAASVNYGSFPYLHPGYLYDVTSGSNGSCSPAYFCNGEVGYDGPTGLGTPNGTGGLGSFAQPFGLRQAPRTDIHLPPKGAATQRMCPPPAAGHVACYAIKIKT